MELEHVPSKHLIGASFGQEATVQLDLFGLMHSPFAHLKGLSFGQPLIIGHLELQDPSGHNLRP